MTSADLFCLAEPGPFSPEWRPGAGAGPDWLDWPLPGPAGDGLLAGSCGDEWMPPARPRKAARLCSLDSLDGDLLGPGPALSRQSSLGDFSFGLAAPENTAPAPASARASLGDLERALADGIRRGAGTDAGALLGAASFLSAAGAPPPPAPAPVPAAARFGSPTSELHRDHVRANRRRAIGRWLDKRRRARLRASRGEPPPSRYRRRSEIARSRKRSGGRFAREGPVWHPAGAES